MALTATGCRSCLQAVQDTCGTAHKMVLADAGCRKAKLFEQLAQHLIESVVALGAGRDVMH
jgi:hypothetical protein